MDNKELEQTIYNRVNDILFDNFSRLKEWEKNINNTIANTLPAVMKELQPQEPSMWAIMFGNFVWGVGAGVPIAVVLYFFK